MQELKPAAMRESRDIEWLVNWTLEKQGLTPGRQISVAESTAAGWQDYGTRIDVSGGGGGIAGAYVHEDAEKIAEALGAMHADRRTSASAELVIRYGRAGMRPDWGHTGCGKYVLVRRNNGKGKAVKRYREARRGRGLLGFEWQWIGLKPETLEQMAIEWTAWHLTLSELREIINPQLRQYVATGPSVPLDPWDDQTFINIEGQAIEFHDVG